MTLARQEVIDGTMAEHTSLEELMRTLSDEEWATPTRCEGWTVSDICGHVTGTIAAIANGQLEGLTAPDAPQREADERKGRSPEVVADELRDAIKVTKDIAAVFDDAAWAGPPPVDLPGTLGEAVEGLWYDAYVHIDDINSALGRLSLRGPGLRASASHLADLLTHRGYGPATLALDGMEEFPVNGGGGSRITGDPLTFLLAATGRADPSQLGLDDTVNVYRD
jgi:uncharacterized protein (TIGR03083 family)